MTDKQAIMSIISSQLAVCGDALDAESEGRCFITACSFCPYKDREDCYVEYITDKILGCIPMLDIYKRRS